ncbi:hypothetical protein HDU91_005711 [Kappamyces sp. JEL0680]|nr:hypothetical protein HDU91_005711 [Kappamyces sp. JEL0680]
MNVRNQNIQVAVRIKNPAAEPNPRNSQSQEIIATREGRRVDRGSNIYADVSIKDPSSRKSLKTYSYDRVFGSGDSQQAVYEVVEPLIGQALDGYNICIFAYGQTASGKTYTMMGVDAQPGIIPRVAETISSHIHSHSRSSKAAGIDFQVTGSYLEIYQEQMRDLLEERQDKDLRIRIDPLSLGGKELYVEGLIQKALLKPRDYTNLIAEGTSRRTVAATNMNETSSRSHAVLTITIDQTERMTDTGGAVGESVGVKKRSKIHLIDLAGSERANSTGATGNRLKEGAAINLSLSALGNVINALSTGSRSHVPYRDSKLTYLLSDSLGGNSLTLLLACITPTSLYYEETVSTLKFAERAKKVQNKARVNLDPATLRIMELEREIERLNAIVAKCTCKLQRDSYYYAVQSRASWWKRLLGCCWRNHRVHDESAFEPSAGVLIHKSSQMEPLEHPV